MSLASRKRRRALRERRRRFYLFVASNPRVVVVVAPDVHEAIPVELRGLVTCSPYLRRGEIAAFAPSPLASMSEVFVRRRWAERFWERAMEHFAPGDRIG